MTIRNNFTIFDGQIFYGFPYKGKVVPLLRNHFFAQLIGAADTVIIDAIFAEVPGYPEKPCLFMRLIFKLRFSLKKPKQRILKNFLCVTHIVQIRLGKTEDAVSVIIQ